ncbi:MAG TPA: hypothetical protein VFL51_14580 [Pseudolabrys sp.]|nr:hypothetical protein [Pseudolabrys sp.]
MLAFIVGTDVGEPGEKEFEAGFTGRFGRSTGSYAALNSELTFQYTPAKNLIVEISAASDLHHIDNVPGLQNRNAIAFGGLGVGLTYRFLDRAAGGFGLAAIAEPHWTRVDDDSGQPVNGYATDLVLALDKDIVPDRLVGVLNLSMEPEISRSRADGTWSRGNTAAVSGGLLLRLSDKVFGGLEARYLRRYDALDFRDFAGEAFYLGPSVSIALSERAWLTVGWDRQIAGRAAGEHGPLDLVNFDRQQARLAFGTTF